MTDTNSTTAGGKTVQHHDRYYYQESFAEKRKLYDKLSQRIVLDICISFSFYVTMTVVNGTEIVGKCYLFYKLERKYKDQLGAF